jgi:transposase
MGKHALALLAALDTACADVDDLGQASAELFQTHPDYAIITSFPGLADSTGARVLAEIGDDRARFSDARALKAYAGSAPITRASGRSISVTHRHIKNNRLANATPGSERPDSQSRFSRFETRPAQPGPG